MQDTVVVHHHTEAEAEAIAAATEVAATEIHLDLEGSLPGGRSHYCTSRRLFSRYPRRRFFLHNPVLAPGCNARSYYDNS